MTAVPAAAEQAVRLDARRRSNSELRFLGLALGVVLVAYALVGLATSGALPPEMAAYGGALAALAVAAHLVSRRLAPGADPVLLPTAFLLNGLGLVMVQRIDFAEQALGRTSDIAAAQTIWTFVAIVGFCATLLLLRDHRTLDGYRYLIGLAAVVLLLLPLLPIFRPVNGARLWIQLGPLNFQPGEVAKLALVVFFASYLAEKRPLLMAATGRLGPLHVPAARAFAPVVVAWGISLAILVLENDLGLSLLVFGLFVAMLYAATGRGAYVVIGGLLFAVGAFTAWSLFDRVQARVQVWLTPFADPDGSAFQLVQSLLAIGSGGLAGVGLGDGRPDLIPEIETDFIFAAFGEELGLIGTTGLLLCYFVLVGRGFTAAMRARDDFSTLLATGLTVTFGLQVFVILGGVTRLIPLTGITLPFVSYGGSSLVANYVLIALLLRVTASSRTEGPPT